MSLDGLGIPVRLRMRPPTFLRLTTHGMVHSRRSAPTSNVLLGQNNEPSIHGTGDNLEAQRPALKTLSKDLGVACVRRSRASHHRLAATPNNRPGRIRIDRVRPADFYNPARELARSDSNSTGCAHRPAQRGMINLMVGTRLLAERGVAECQPREPLWGE